MATKLQRLYEEFGQSPWLDNLKRGYLTSGQLQRLVDQGIRGITSNPTIFQKAISGSSGYAEIIEAYLSGLEAHDGDLARVHSVASFFVSRVDTEVDRRLEAIGTDEALSLRGEAAVAQARLAYELFRQRFSGDRWQALVDR